MTKTTIAGRQLHVGQQVKLANLPHMIFKIVAYNNDGSYRIVADIAGQQRLEYDHVAQEMLALS
jgi:hypothetical protein